MPPEDTEVTYSDEQIDELLEKHNPAQEGEVFYLRNLVALVRQLRRERDERDARIEELERRLRIPFGKLPCALCGGPHAFDTSVPTHLWNEVIRAQGLPEYLCTTCIVKEFVKARRDFTARLYGDGFAGETFGLILDDD